LATPNSVLGNARVKELVIRLIVVGGLAIHFDAASNSFLWAKFFAEVSLRGLVVCLFMVFAFAECEVIMVLVFMVIFVGFVMVFVLMVFFMVFLFVSVIIVMMLALIQLVQRNIAPVP